MLGYLISKLRSKKIKALKGKIKGSLKDPSFCLFGIRAEEGFFSFRSRIIIVFLFVFVFWGLGLVAAPLAEKGNFDSADFSGVPGQAGEDNLFIVGPASNFLPESPEFLLVENSFIRASSPPTSFSPQVLGALVGSFQEEADQPGEEVRKAVVEHIVESGETLSSLAVKYNISLDTIVWANQGLTRSSTLKVGQKLVILPVSGTIHHVKSNDTISQIAQTYKGSIDEIVAFNQLSDEGDIYIGDIVIIPEGVMPLPSVKRQPASTRAPLASSYFILPVSSPYIITQGLHWYNAIDFSHKGYACGKPVFAAAGGTVQRVVYGRAGYGHYLTILHPNDVVTLYAHLSNIFVSPGQQVSQGTRIGLMGNTGYTVGATGCHLHFEVRGAANPFAR